MRKSATILRFYLDSTSKQDEYYEAALDVALTGGSGIFPPDFDPVLAYGFSKLMPHFVSEFPRLLRQTSLVMVVAAFESFVMDSLRTVLDIKPKLLKVELNKKKRKKLTNPTDLRREKLNRKMEQLASDSIEKKFDFVRSTCPDFDDKHLQTESVIEIFETRHIIVHNGGIVSQRYIQKIPKSDFAVDDERPIDDKYLRDSHRTINFSALRLCGLFLKEFCGVTLPKEQPA